MLIQLNIIRFENRVLLLNIAHAINDRMAAQIVKQIMTEGPVDTIERGLSVESAAEIMKNKARGSLVVLDNGKAVGIITERDLVRRVVAEHKNPSQTKVADVMSQPLISAGPEETITNIANVMYNHGIRRLPIIDQGKLLGIVTATDLIREVQKQSGSAKSKLLLAAGRFKMESKDLLRKPIQTKDGFIHEFIVSQTENEIVVLEGVWKQRKYVIPKSCIDRFVFEESMVYLNITEEQLKKYIVK